MKIKLRAWDTEGKQMLDWLTLMQTAFNCHKPTEHVPDRLNLLYTVLSSPRFEKLLFTGLRDKNGMEIYEGDILKCHEYDSSECSRQIVQTFDNAVVGFQFGSFYYYPKGDMSQPHQLLFYAYQPEVIGNIYENVELLSKPNGY